MSIVSFQAASVSTRKIYKNKMKTNRKADLDAVHDFIMDLVDGVVHVRHNDEDGADGSQRGEGSEADEDLLHLG